MRRAPEAEGSLHLRADERVAHRLIGVEPDLLVQAGGARSVAEPLAGAPSPVRGRGSHSHERGRHRARSSLPRRVRGSRTAAFAGAARARSWYKRPAMNRVKFWVFTLVVVAVALLRPARRDGLPPRRHGRRAGRPPRERRRPRDDVHARPRSRGRRRGRVRRARRRARRRAAREGGGAARAAAAREGQEGEARRPARRRRRRRGVEAPRGRARGARRRARRRSASTCRPARS